MIGLVEKGWVKDSNGLSQKQTSTAMTVNSKKRGKTAIHGRKPDGTRVLKPGGGQGGVHGGNRGRGGPVSSKSAFVMVRESDA